MTQNIENCKTEIRWVVNSKSFNGYAVTYLPDGNKCPYTGKTAAEYIAEGYDVLNDDEFSSLLVNYENSLCGHWKEESAEDYEEALCVLPPVAWYDGGFFMSERWAGNISAFHQEMNGRYYTCLQRMSTPRAAICADLAKFVRKEGK